MITLPVNVWKELKVKVSRKYGKVSERGCSQIEIDEARENEEGMLENVLESFLSASTVETEVEVSRYPYRLSNFFR